MKKATLAGGCFWCTEAVFKDLIGVEDVQPGFMGGHVERPSYQEVCAGGTGHAEVAHFSYDPALISFSDILDVFFTMHDPTQINRQGNDVGEHYRSAVFFYDAEQERDAHAAAKRAADIWDGTVVTQIVPAGPFWAAENYHVDYFANNPDQPYCAAVVAPKVAKARKMWASKMKPKG
ncbi:peptide methionine sulfoxide reductase MsrA [Iodidimonas muriae]|uniref:Peptide methionine sulfoxide reductase MsrA n=1 Tax=Iodidimonas muriae TaxID=261467 RepID=A0ABQ2LFR6_9PROT|nr:peptide-methionine (S)-S-oxide reductase MsrA [Iodidimonas muriae]GER08630.1 peptide methionine sulfoxide reductase MsrA [Kordiimonadales bacterium JCM 17843]GGO15754.1 peptide methionine sulfoxide reductase MsrA [Iodidimonas muriae]